MKRLPLKISLGIFSISLIALMVEMTLIHVFDVLLDPNLGFMTITCAMFSFAMAGVFLAIKPMAQQADISRYLFRLTLFFAFLCLVMRPLTNILPFDRDTILSNLGQLIAFMIMFLALSLLFFISGLFIIIIFSHYSNRIHQVYFWNLTGSALGCIVFIPFLPLIGPGGILIIACASAVLTAALFCRKKIMVLIMGLLGALIFMAPLIYLPKIYDFMDHNAGRGLKMAQLLGQIEYSRWDAISKIDVMDQSFGHVSDKYIFYDGGLQGSHFRHFDGDLKKLRQELPMVFRARNMFADRFLANYLKRDSGQKVLIIGSAGGEDILAALTYGASQVRGVELVKTVVALGKQKYAQYTGNIFNDPRVRIDVGEGRSFLRSTTDRFDIIQLYSTGTSSSIARGIGATNPQYLQTTEAYKEYFTHLNPEGILQINFIYPARMITTAARAWKELGRGDFEGHVVVIEVGDPIGHPTTFLVKMSPWTKAQMDDLNGYLKQNIFKSRGKPDFKVIIDPIDPRNNIFPSFYFSGEISSQLARNLDYSIEPPTDDRPYFSFIRKSLKFLNPDTSAYLDNATASILNAQLGHSQFPNGMAHLFVCGIVSLVFSIMIIFLPLVFSPAGRGVWPGKAKTLAYFACLGAGFIIIELVFIQIFMKLIGYPLYSYSTVIFAFLISAGIGSYCSSRSKFNGRALPFYGIIFFGLLMIFFQEQFFNFFMTFPLGIRIAGSLLMIMPLGFFMGMPFPMGIWELSDKPKGAIAWGWGMNGIFTVIGGLLSVVFSILWGFRAALGLAIIFYVIAFNLFKERSS